MPRLTHDNHFLSQGYLRNWSTDGRRVFAYRILVSHPNVPEWSARSIRGVAFRKDLYTWVDRSGQEHDDIERWLADEIESPALAAIEKAVNGRRLHPEDWRSMAMFFAAQDLRTPLRYMDFVKQCGEELPKLLPRMLSESTARIEQAARDGVGLPTPDAAEGDEMPTGLEIGIEGGKGVRAVVHATPSIGRVMWLSDMKRLLTGLALKLGEHKWSIAHPARGHEWITSDHPALKLNYCGLGRYDFQGGWGSCGTDLILPLSPQHLLYTQIGKKAEPRFWFSVAKTRELQKLTAERAHRWIFSRAPLPEISQYRPRRIDAVAFDAEERAWQEWHGVQSASEMESREGPKADGRT